VNFEKKIGIIQYRKKGDKIQYRNNPVTVRSQSGQKTLETPFPAILGVYNALQYPQRVTVAEKDQNLSKRL